MIMRFKNSSRYAAILLLSGLFLSGCDITKSDKPVDENTDDNTGVKPSDMMNSYQVTIINVTNDQPFSPLTVVTHSADYSMWKVGQAASSELEWLAEQGLNTPLKASLAKIDATFVTGTRDIKPSINNKETVTITVSAVTQDRITIASMLVNSNDAFVGLDAFDVSTMNVGDIKQRHGIVFDAGTELNDEAKATVPGPAAGGEAHNPERSDPVNFVRIHSGVLTIDDGLASSSLTEAHRFDNPAMFITIKRIK